MTPWEGCKYPPRAWQAECYPIGVQSMRAGIRGLVVACMGAGKSVLSAEWCYGALPQRGNRAIVVVAPSQDLVVQLSNTIADRCGQENVGRFYADEKHPFAAIIVCCSMSIAALRDELGYQRRPVCFLLLDEAHKSEADTLLTAVPTLRSAAQIALTGTPFRSLKTQTLSLVDEIIYRYDVTRALRDKVLVPIRHVRYMGLAPLSIDEECLAMIERDGEGPGIVSATTIEDCERYAEWLCKRGVSAEPIHSRLNGDQRRNVVERLKRERLRCLVHVSLLAEGVDFPWLRWICLRRKVGASVRFFQETFRVARCHPGKTEAVVMDPHLLFGKFGKTATLESIGKALEDAANLEADREARARELEEAEVVALDALVGFADELRDSMERAGLCGPRHEPNGTWRIADVSKKQVEMIGKIKGCTRHMPETYRAPIKALAHHPWALTRGQASNVVDVLLASAGYAREKAKTSRQHAHFIHWSSADIARLDVPTREAVIIEKMREKA